MPDPSGTLPIWSNMDYMWSEVDTTWDELDTLISPPASGNPIWDNMDYQWQEVDCTWDELDTFVGGSSSYTDFHASVNVIQPSGLEHLGASVNIIQTGLTDFGAIVTILQDGSVDFLSKIAIPTNEDLTATVIIKQTSSEDVDGRIFIPVREDLSAKINLVTPDYTNFLATVFINHCENLSAKINTFHPSESDETISSSVITGHVSQSIQSYVKTGHVSNSIGTTVKVGVNSFPIDSVVRTGHVSDSIDSTVKLGPANSDFGAKIRVYEDSGYINFKSVVSIIKSDESDLFSKLFVPAVSDVSSLIDITANTPSGIYPSGYIVPSGYPPLPNEWNPNSNGIAIPPSGAELIPNEEWQQEEEILFVWEEPEWGYDAVKDGYRVAWNDDPNYVITEADQYVTDNYIRKTWYDSGSKYFHIRARNSHNHLGLQSTYNIKINQLPLVPNDLYIDSITNLTGINKGGSPTFNWENTTDPDQLDVISYHIQVCPSGSLNSPIIDNTNIPQPDAGNITSYFLSSYQIGQGLSVFDTYCNGYAYSHEDFINFEETYEHSEEIEIEDIDGSSLSEVTGRSNNFFQKFYGYIYAPYEGTYTFATNSDDSSEIVIDDEVVCTYYGGHSAGGWQTGTKYLTTGWHTFVYYHCELSGGAVWRAGWKKPNDDYITIIPKENFGTRKLLGSTIDIGNYLWRVRAFDTKQYSEWTEWHSLVIESETSNISAKIKVVSYWLSNFKSKINIIPYENLPAKIFVYPKKDLDARLTIPIVEDLSAKVYVKPYKNLDARIEVYNGEPLTARVNIETDLQEIKSKINVRRYGYTNLRSKIDVSGDLKGKITVEIPTSDDLNAKTTVVKLENSDISAKAYIKPYENIPATINIFANSDFNATVDISPNKPDNVTVTSDILEATWQGNDNPTFSWENPYDEFTGIECYYVAWNQQSDYEITTADQRVIGNSIQKFAFDAGVYYFHIKAENDYGNLSSETTHYIIYYNNAPTAPSGVFKVDNLESPSISNTLPSFSWGNSFDADQLDVLTYHLQISKTNTFEHLIANIENITQASNSNRTILVLPEEKQLSDIGQYYWRVRAYDNRQYGEWSSVNSFVVEASTSSIGGKITIPVRAVTNFQSTINIIGHKELNGNINIRKDNNIDLEAKIIVSYYTDREVKARIKIPRNENLGAKISISPKSDIKTRINIIDVYGSGNLTSIINVCYESSTEVKASLNVKYGNSSNLSGYINVYIYDYKNIKASITPYVPSVDFKSNIFITRKDNRDLNGILNSIAERPSEVSISANVEEASWQESSIIQFSWSTASYTFIPIEGYYIRLDQNAETIADDSFKRNNSFSEEYDLEDISGAGVYYFHIAAKNENKYWSPTSHFEIRYNHIPSNPSAPMTVNGQNSITSKPTVSVNSPLLFSWGQSNDEDQLDSIKYRLQIATKEDFCVENDGNQSIIYDIENIPTFSYEIPKETIESKQSYYWRVKAFDEHQESTGWSPVGSFSVNTPPLVPTGLVVYKA